MPFNLFVTSPSGQTRKALRSPYSDREDTRSTIRMVLTGGTEPITADQARDFTRQVIETPLGETVKHEATGLAFRTEEI